MTEEASECTMIVGLSDAFRITPNGLIKAIT